MGSGAVAQGGVIAGRIVVRVAEFAAARGHDPEPMCRSVGLSMAALRAPDAWVSYAVAERLGMLAAELVGDPNFGLHLAQDVRDPGHFDAGLLLMMASPSLGASLERVQHYQRYWAEGERFTLHPLADGTCVRFMLPHATGDYQRHSDECAMAEIVLGARMLTGRELVPRVVRFRHPAPADLREHAELFRCPLEFDTRHAELELDREALEIAVANSERRTARSRVQQVERALASLPAASGLTPHVRAAAQAALSSGDCSVGATARLPVSALGPCSAGCATRAPRSPSWSTRCAASWRPPTSIGRCPSRRSHGCSATRSRARSTTPSSAGPVPPPSRRAPPAPSQGSVARAISGLAHVRTARFALREARSLAGRLP